MNKMSVVRIACYVCAFTIALAKNVSFSPKITVEAFKPKGFRIYVPGGDAKIKFLRIDVTLMSSSITLASLQGFVVRETNGYWIFEKPDVKLKTADIVQYHIFFGTKNSYISDYPSNDELKLLHFNGYSKTERFIITNVSDLDEREEFPPINKRECLSKLHLTQVPNGQLCAGDVLLEEHFDDLLDPNLWEVEQYIPLDHPEHPFVSYQNIDSGTVFVSEGALNIQPMLQTDLNGFSEKSLYTGSLDLYSGCTGRVCAMQAEGPFILPPIVSGRIRSRIDFTYGTVHIRAKMPIGDWIYPEIILEPLYNTYGSRYYSSGIIKIAMARGNKNMNDSNYGSGVLKGRPILNSYCKGIFDFYKNKRSDGSSWGDDFHVYSLTWTPGYIQLFVDDKLWVTYRPGSAGLRSWFPKGCRNEWFTLLTGPKIAPFNEHFHLSLGVAVGGTFEFPDNVVTSYGKPWKNTDSRAVSDFWKAKKDWLATWTQPKLIIDYVKIVAV